MAGRTGSAEDCVAYAREVYAACATVGFADDSVARLRRLLDDEAAGRGDPAGLLAAARAAQSASIDWVGR